MYYVPSILKLAMDEFGSSIAAKQVVGHIWAGGAMDETMRAYAGLVADQLEKAVKRWCLRRLGMAA